MLRGPISFVALIVLLLALSGLSLQMGAVPLRLSQTLTLEVGPDTTALFSLRAPRILAAILIGVHLGIAGLILQIVLHNPLADPTILGISGGAALAVVSGIAIAIAIAPDDQSVVASASLLSPALVPPLAMTGGILATLLIVVMAWDNGLPPIRLALFGAVLAVVLNGCVMVFVLSMTEARTELAIIWLAGSLYGRDLHNIWPVLPWTLVCFGGLIYGRTALGVMRFDTLTARGLGLDTRITVPLLLAVATGLAASAVSVAGPIGFVGLLAPHIARFLFRPALKELLIGSALTGACLVTAGDLLGRVLVPPLEVPVGLMTSLVGAPLFALLISLHIRRAAS